MSNKCDEQEELSFEDHYQNIMRRKNENIDETVDLLNRSGDIDNICRIIRQKAEDKSYYSLALTGEWGSGKSYVLTQVEKTLKSEFLIIHYDCWKNDFYEEPLYGILYSLVQYFNGEDDSDFSQSKYYEAMKNIIFGVVQLTPLVNIISKDTLPVVSEKMLGIKKTINKKKIDSNIDSFQKDIHSVLDKIQAALATYIAFENKKIIIAVDELDRCLPNYALKVLNRLHHICYGASLILVTAVNKKELLGCINTEFGKELCDDFSSRYLDRFFDYTYNLSNGRSSDLLSLWNGLEAFDDTIVSKEFLNDFCNILLSDFSMREKKKLIGNVYSFHKIVAKDCHDKLTYAVLCAELMYAVKYFYLADYYWKFVMSNFNEFPYDDYEDGDAQPEKNFFTLRLVKSNGNGKPDVQINLQILKTEYDNELPHFYIPIESAKNRIKAFFAEEFIPYSDDNDFFVYKSKDVLFRKEVDVFTKFKIQLQQMN